MTVFDLGARFTDIFGPGRSTNELRGVPHVTLHIEALVHDLDRLRKRHERLAVVNQVPQKFDPAETAAALLVSGAEGVDYEVTRAELFNSQLVTNTGDFTDRDAVRLTVEATILSDAASVIESATELYRAVFEDPDWEPKDVGEAVYELLAGCRDESDLHNAGLDIDLSGQRYEVSYR